MALRQVWHAAMAGRNYNPSWRQRPKNEKPVNRCDHDHRHRKLSYRLDDIFPRPLKTRHRRDVACCLAHDSSGEPRPHSDRTQASLLYGTGMQRALWTAT
jgi:hypothetical protein